MCFRDNLQSKKSINILKASGISRNIRSKTCNIFNKKAIWIKSKTSSKFQIVPFPLLLAELFHEHILIYSITFHSSFLHYSICKRKKWFSLLMTWFEAQKTSSIIDIDACSISEGNGMNNSFLKLLWKVHQVLLPQRV